MLIKSFLNCHPTERSDVGSDGVVQNAIKLYLLTDSEIDGGTSAPSRVLGIGGVQHDR